MRVKDVLDKYEDNDMFKFVELRTFLNNNLLDRASMRAAKLIWSIKYVSFEVVTQEDFPQNKLLRIFVR